MKKIPTLFKREYANHRVVDIKDEITAGCEDAFLHGRATVKLDGACCAVIDGELYKRYDAKNGKKSPAGAIPCCDPDPITGHWPHWVKVEPNNPADKWFVEAYTNASVKAQLRGESIQNGTYEACGPHFQSNPHGFALDCIIEHGLFECQVERTFDGVKKYLNDNEIEGIVFWLNGEPVCKIKRSDFGFEWPVNNKHFPNGDCK